MRVSESVVCAEFPCVDVRHDGYIVPHMDLRPEDVSMVMISEAAPADAGDDFYAGGESRFEKTTVQAFDDAGADVVSIQDILDLGVYLTTPVRCGKTDCRIKAAPTLPLGTGAELEEADLSGRIGLLHAEPTKGTGIAARNAAYVPDHHQHIVRLLERKGPAALVTIQSRVGSLERLIRDPEVTIPSAPVPAQVGPTLLRHSGRPVHLSIDSRRTPARFANVVASSPGPRSQRIVLLAHCDTTIGPTQFAGRVGPQGSIETKNCAESSPNLVSTRPSTYVNRRSSSQGRNACISHTTGAVDNGSAVALLLALAESLSQRTLSANLAGSQCRPRGGRRCRSLDWQRGRIE